MSGSSNEDTFRHPCAHLMLTVHPTVTQKYCHPAQSGNGAVFVNTQSLCSLQGSFVINKFYISQFAWTLTKTPEGILFRPTWLVEHLGFDYKVRPVKIVDERDFPKVAKALPSSAGVVGLIPGQGAKILHALQLKSQNIKQKQCCNKFNKDFKTLKSHLKKNSWWE